MPVTLKLPFPPVIVPVVEEPSPQLIVAEYALGVALGFGSVMVATVPPTVEPAGPENERPPVGTVSTISVLNENVCEAPAARPDVPSIPVALSTLLRAAVAHGWGGMPVESACHSVGAVVSVKPASDWSGTARTLSRTWSLLGASVQATPTTVAPKVARPTPKPVSLPRSWQSAAWYSSPLKLGPLRWCSRP